MVKSCVCTTVRYGCHEGGLETEIDIECKRAQGSTHHLQQKRDTVAKELRGTAQDL